MYKKWIQSYRDLPLLINQWANVLRWEKRTRLFLRTSEFLWQEGHTAHETKEEAEEETLKMLEVYRRFVEEYMAVPVLTGRKSETEKFAGAINTYAIEAMMQDKRALQAGTSHFLGQNFAKAFDVTYQTKEGKLDHVWATSWGVSTRLIGALIMTHSDDRGLVVPPRLAPTEAAIIPIFKNKNKAEVVGYAEKLYEQMKGRYRVVFDDDEANSPGWKFAEWEMKGVPVRIEIGPRDMENGKAMLVRRDTGEKEPVAIEEVADRVGELLEQIQKDLFEKARALREDNTYILESYDDLKKLYKDGNGFVDTHWCGSPECEAVIKDETKATIRVIPFEQGDCAGKKCIRCGGPAQHRVIFAKAY